MSVLRTYWEKWLCGAHNKRWLTAGLSLCYESEQGQLCPPARTHSFFGYNAFESKGINIQPLDTVLCKNTLTDYILLLHIG